MKTNQEKQVFSCSDCVNVLGPPPLHVIFCAQAGTLQYVTQLNTVQTTNASVLIVNTDLQDHLLPLSYSI
jgi:hypothetical protein